MRREQLEAANDSGVSWREMFENVHYEFQVYKLNSERFRHDIENRLSSIQSAADMLSVSELTGHERLTLQALMQKAIAELTTIVENMQLDSNAGLKSPHQYLVEMTLSEPISH